MQGPWPQRGRPCRPSDAPPYPPHGLKWRGQVLVEFALAVPIILFIILGGIESGMLLIYKMNVDRETGVVADWAARHPGDESWHAVANAQLPGCDVILEDSGKPGVVTIGSRCQYQPVATHGLWDGLPVSSEESSVTADPTPTDTPMPS